MTRYIFYKIFSKPFRFFDFFATYRLKALSDTTKGGAMTVVNDKNDKILADEELIELYFERNEDAIRLTEKKYGRLIFKVAYNILGNRQDSEQCENDTYLGLWNAIPPARPSRIAAFVITVARRTAISKYREERGKKQVPSELIASMEELSEVVSADDASADAESLKAIINAYVRSLNSRRRYIFIGRYYMAESVDALARTLGITESSVYKELTKIKNGLKKHLEKNGVNI